eukprot:UN19998
MLLKSSIIRIVIP